MSTLNAVLTADGALPLNDFFQGGLEVFMFVKGGMASQADGLACFAACFTDFSCCSRGNLSCLSKGNSFKRKRMRLPNIKMPNNSNNVDATLTFQAN